MDRHQPLLATGTHISLVGHITRHELAKHLHRTDAHNGFVNRCLWTCVRRSQCLPEGSSPEPDQLSAIVRELRRAVDWVSTTEDKPLFRDPAARELWNRFYEDLSQSHPGLYGAATSRAEAQVLRLSAIYASLDCSPVIEPLHLRAALAVWDYCSASTALIFHASTGDAVLDRIRRALDETPEGLTRKEIRALFHGHVSSERIDMALQKLTTEGLASSHSSSGRGRPATLWSGIEASAPAEQMT
jgi:DNA replicative helicase MCM subunit Mcm2 (Cdc46/Mcm family)